MNGSYFFASLLILTVLAVAGCGTHDQNIAPAAPPAPTAPLADPSPTPDPSNDHLIRDRARGVGQLFLGIITAPYVLIEMTIWQHQHPGERIFGGC
jgi:hypothetical protein